MSGFWEITKARVDVPNVAAAPVAAEVFWVESTPVQEVRQDQRLIGVLWARQVQVVDFYRRSA